MSDSNTVIPAGAWQRSMIVRPHDVDYIDHMRATSYSIMYSDARFAFLVDAWATTRPQCVVVRQEIEFLKEVLLSDSPVTIYLAVAQVGYTSIELAEWLTNHDSQLCSYARTKLAMYDRDTHKAREVSLSERQALFDTSVPTATTY